MFSKHVNAFVSILLYSYICVYLNIYVYIDIWCGSFWEGKIKFYNVGMYMGNNTTKKNKEMMTIKFRLVVPIGRKEGVISGGPLRSLGRSWVGVTACLAAKLH